MQLQRNEVGLCTHFSYQNEVYVTILVHITHQKKQGERKTLAFLWNIDKTYKTS